MTKEKFCLKCGYHWEPRIDNPKCCPACMSRHWNNKEKASLVEGRAA